MVRTLLMTTLLNRTIRLFLDSIGRREEYEFYLEKFTRFDYATFALICPEEDDFENTAQALAFDLDALRRLGLFPALLLTGDHVQRMKMLLLDADHAFDVLALEDLSSAQMVAAAEQFLRRCSLQRQTGILTASGPALLDILNTLIPTITRRVHILRPSGQLRNVNGAALNYIYTNDETQAPLKPEDQALATLGITLLNAHPGTHISICSTWTLLHELFTVKGAGTIVRRHSKIHRVSTSAEIDEPRLLALLTEAFGRTPRKDQILPRVQWGYIEDSYRGAALVETHPAGAYLSKFAVGTEARGEGLAGELWHALVLNHPALFWRSRVDQPVNHWYERQAQGYHSTDKWRVFWYGIAPEHLPAIIAYSLSRESDFDPA